MTNFQLLFVSGIPTLAVVIGILYNNARFNLMQTSIDARFNSIDARFSSIEARITALETRIDQRLTVIEADLRRFFEILGAHGADIEMLKKR